MSGGGWRVYILFKSGRRFYNSRTFETKEEAERVKAEAETVLLKGESVHIEPPYEPQK